MWPVPTPDQAQSRVCRALWWRTPSISRLPEAVRVKSEEEAQLDSNSGEESKEHQQGERMPQEDVERIMIIQVRCTTRQTVHLSHFSQFKRTTWLYKSFQLG